MEDDLFAATQKPTSSEVDALSSTVGSSRRTTTSYKYVLKTNANNMVCRDQSLLSWCEAKLARQIICSTRIISSTITSFESRFRYPLWDSEKEHLA